MLESEISNSAPATLQLRQMEFYFTLLPDLNN